MSTIGESSETFTSPSRLRKSVKERDVRRIIPLPPRHHPLRPQYRRKRRSAPHETHRGQPPRRASTSRVTGRRAAGSTSRVTRLRRDRGRRTKWREADRKRTRLNSSHECATRMPSSTCKTKSRNKTTLDKT